MVLISLLAGFSIVSTDKSSPSLPCYLEHHCDFLNSGTSATAGRLNSTIIKGYKQILGKFGEIQREFVDVYSPDSDNDCRVGGGGHQHRRARRLSAGHRTAQSRGRSGGELLASTGAVPQ